MSIEPIIARLIGRAETGEARPNPLSREESHALSQRLRALVREEAAGSSGPDHGPAAEALRLATYLDGAMDPVERATFERELVDSPERRDELIGAVAWLDDLAAKRALPPADALELAMALDTPAPPTPRGRGMAAIVEWLLPRPRLAMATSALATVAIAAVGLDIALHMSPLMNRPPVVESGQPTQATYDRPFLPNSTIRPGQSDQILLTAETINAVIAYQDKPAEPQRLELLRVLARAGAPAFDARSVRSIALQPKLSERLRQRDGRLPTTISASLSLDGTLRLDSAD